MLFFAPQSMYRKAVKKMAKEREGLKAKAKEADERSNQAMSVGELSTHWLLLSEEWPPISRRTVVSPLASRLLSPTFRNQNRERVPCIHTFPSLGFSFRGLASLPTHA